MSSSFFPPFKNVSINEGLLWGVMQSRGCQMKPVIKVDSAVYENAREFFGVFSFATSTRGQDAIIIIRVAVKVIDIFLIFFSFIHESEFFCV